MPRLANTKKAALSFKYLKRFSLNHCLNPCRGFDQGPHSGSYFGWVVSFFLTNPIEPDEQAYFGLAQLQIKYTPMLLTAQVMATVTLYPRQLFTAVVTHLTMHSQGAFEAYFKLKHRWFLCRRLSPVFAPILKLHSSRPRGSGCRNDRKKPWFRTTRETWQ
jgi:hypothetical protein